MRRVALLVGIISALFALSDPAAAHRCAPVAEIPVGASRTIQAGVTVEATPVPDVEVTLPAEVQIDRVDPVVGWQIARRGQTIRYRGGPIPVFQCIYFPIGVTATKKGEFPILLVQRDADANILARSVVEADDELDPNLVQVIYAGVKPPSLPGEPMSATAKIGIALVALAAVLLIFRGWRAWRGRRGPDDDDDAGDREAELQERLATFKKQARDRPTPQ